MGPDKAWGGGGNKIWRPGIDLRITAWKIFSLRPWVRYASIFAKKDGTLVRYDFFVMVRVRYVGTVRLFCNGSGTVRWYAVWIKNIDFSHIGPDFCMQRQKTTEADAKCVNWDRWFID